MKNFLKGYTLEAVILAAGLFLLGWCIDCGITRLAEKDRHVSVRGLAEREVQADRVIWPLVYKTVGTDLTPLYEDLSRANANIVAYLQKNGIDKDEISVGAPQIVDRWADNYSTERPQQRYNATSVVTVTSAKVEAVRKLILRSGELLRQGVALSVGDYDTRTQYQFTGLNSIKPRMIEEATQNARQAAEKFAKDSGSRLGRIQSASQGLFSVEDRDQYTPHIKKVRVVTMVNYQLDN